MSGEPTPTDASPIADLSYRGYDGALRSRSIRWWVITRTMLRVYPRRPVFWICTALACLPYLFTGLMLYARSLSQGMGGGPFGAEPEKYAVSFFTSLRAQGFFLFLLALFIGAGSISADLRANALQVYFSKAIRKSDYLIGKWLGIFVPLYGVALAPALMLFAFCVLSFGHQGFWDEDRLLILRLLVATAVPGLVHASLLVGFSAWSRSPFMAGATYAAAYVVSGIVANLAWLFRYGLAHQGASDQGVLAQSMSIQGIVLGVTQNLYQVDLHNTGYRRRTGTVDTVTLHPPEFAIVAAVALLLIVGGLVAARARVRAVEVIRG